MDKKVLKEIMSELGKESHKKSPRTKEHYKFMQAKGVETRNKRKLSTGKY